MTAEKPAPCPVCGSRPKIQRGEGYVLVGCIADPTPQTWHEIGAAQPTRPAAIAAWNRAYGGKNANAE